MRCRLKDSKRPWGLLTPSAMQMSMLSAASPANCWLRAELGSRQDDAARCIQVKGPDSRYISSETDVEGASREERVMLRFQVCRGTWRSCCPVSNAWYMAAGGRG